MAVPSAVEVPDRLLRVSAQVGRCAPEDVAAEPIPYAFGSPATAGLWKVDAGAGRWCVKWLRHVSLWPGVSSLPAGVRDDFVAQFPWRFELDMAESGIGAVMPPGMRTARLDHVEHLDELNVVLWSEWIDDDGSPWLPGDYTTAARALGRLAARRRQGASVNEDLPELCRRVPVGYALRLYAENRTLAATVPMLSAEGVRTDPLVAAALDEVGPSTWDDLLVLGARIPELLVELESLPQTFAHGDASPQNLLRPSGEPGTVVAIDWGFGSLLAVGFDLGQLLVGLVHAGLAPADGIPTLVEPVLGAYCAGLADEGWEVPPDVVRRGFVGSVLCRSPLDSVPLELVGAAPSGEALARMTERLRLARVLLDLEERTPQ